MTALTQAPSEAQIIDLIAAVRPDRAVDKEAATDAAEAFARASWTGIAEPGDGTAGRVVALLGAGAALAAIQPGQTAGGLSARVAEAGGTDLSIDDLAPALARWAPRVSAVAATGSLRQAARLGVMLVLPGDPEWPSGLDDLHEHAPTALWLRGNRATLAASEGSIALVGARAATGYGEHVAMEASAGLVDRGYAIVSGAAYGIDGMAHRAALASSGQTIAFLAGGVDRFYPSGHDALLTRITEFGAVVSELPCGSPPTKWRFLQRNRLIAAASQATIVLEAGWRSGSLNTASHAATLGRPIGAVPGPVTSAASAGCHRLLRTSAAVCVTNAEEMAELAPLRRMSPVTLFDDEPESRPTGRPSDHTRLLDSLSVRAPREVIDLARRSGLSVGSVLAALGTLELDGVVRQRDNGWTKL